MAYPCYVTGENPAPPEDCGGIPGFYAQLEALAGDFDPNRFEDQLVKNRLGRITNRRRSASAKRKSR